MISYCENENQGVGCRSTRRNSVSRLEFRSWGVLQLLGILMLLLLVSEAHDPFDGLEAKIGTRSAMGESVKAGSHDLYTVSNLVSATGHSKAAAGRAGQGQCKTDDCQDFDFLIRDDDRDGRCKIFPVQMTCHSSCNAVPPSPFTKLVSSRFPTSVSLVKSLRELHHTHRPGRRTRLLRALTQT